MESITWIKKIKTLGTKIKKMLSIHGEEEIGWVFISILNSIPKVLVFLN